MGRVGPQTFGAGQKKNGRGRNFGGGRTDDFINFYYDSNILLMILVFSLRCLQTPYCNEHSTQFTVCYLNSYSIISMRRHYFQKSKD